MMKETNHILELTKVAPGEHQANRKIETDQEEPSEEIDGSFEKIYVVNNKI